MTLWKSLVGAALSALIVSGAQAQSAAASAAQPDTIRFGGFGQGFGQPYGLALLAIAQGKGFLADEFKGTPTRLTFEYFTGTGPAINEAIANRRLDVAQYGALPNIVGRAAGLPTRLIASYGPTTVFAAARAELPIHSFKDLAGKRVAVAKGTVLHWAFLKGLEANGLTLKDVTLLDLSTADQLAALAAGSIDAAVGTSTLLALRDKGAVKIFYSSNDVGPKAAGFGAIAVTEAFEKAYPDAVRRVARGLVRSAAWLADDSHRDEALAIWSKSGVALSSLKAEFDGVALKNGFNPRIDPFLIEQYRDAIAFSKAQKLIRADIDLNQWVAPSYVDDAINQLGVAALFPVRPAAPSAAAY
jgi:sulfonate transport system substrate-binding protein